MADRKRLATAHLVVIAGHGIICLVRMGLAQRRLRLAVGLAAICAGAVGCGEDEHHVRGTPDAQHAREVAGDPYALNCGDLARQRRHPDSEKLVIRAEFALAREPALRRRVASMTENRVGRSVYWALSETCKGGAPSFEPARLAVEAVRRGRYLVQPRSGSWSSAERWWKAHPEDRPEPHRGSSTQRGPSRGPE